MCISAVFKRICTPEKIFENSGLMKSVEPALHKDKFIRYLEEFIQELQRHFRRISGFLRSI